MSRVAETMSRDHAACDERFTAAEAAVAEGDLARAGSALAAFTAALERHLGVEESELFPAFEQRTGMTDGPTAMMRLEHAEMRELVRQLGAALDAADAAEFLGLTDTLNVLMQQHNLKEEQVLYALLDEALGSDAEPLLAGLASP
ncbi:MAG TPA: hemerythrin domain-containing protein [Burkholderiales bacterium]|nr:hemerythrin domain-containing protein [Burkholderiales bacterium]